MQYHVSCLDCGHGLHAPNESQAEQWRREHIKEKGHVVGLLGRYDEPQNPMLKGPDGEITGGQRRQIITEMRSWAEHPEYELYSPEWRDKLNALLEAEGTR